MTSTRCAPFASASPASDSLAGRLAMNADDDPRHDGWNEVAYELLEDDALNAELWSLLNEACHVFHLHAEGTWESHDKDAYARQLAIEMAKFPGLRHRLLKTGDRVIRMLAYRAMELLDTDDPGAP